MKNIQKISIRIQRQTYLATAMVIGAASVLIAFPMSQASAVQLTNRSVKMSDSGISNNATIPTGVGSGTNVSYEVNFSTTSTSTAIGGVVVDFCANTPLVGDSCSAPTGFNANSASLSVNDQTGLGTGSFAVYTTTPVANRVILTRATPAAPTATGSFELGNGTTNGITNPSVNGPFFARIYTYTTAAAAQGHNMNSPTGYLDYGGVALRTANVITITARVQESLIFCVFGGVAPNNNCAPATGSVAPALEIGHQNGGTGARFIDATAVDTADAFMQISTNAGGGSVIRMRNSVPEGGLKSGSAVIPPVGSGSGSPLAAGVGEITNGTAAFGLIVFPGTGSDGTLTPDTNYYNASYDSVGEGFRYGMDSATLNENVTATFGDQIASTPSVASNLTSRLTFAATASNVTPAGLYSANLALVATGTF